MEWRTIYILITLLTLAVLLPLTPYVLYSITITNHMEMEWSGVVKFKGDG